MTPTRKAVEVPTSIGVKLLSVPFPEAFACAAACQQSSHGINLYRISPTNNDIMVTAPKLILVS